MGFNYRRDFYKPDYFCGIGPKEIDKSRNEFSIGQGSSDKNIEDKVEKQGMIKGPYTHVLDLIERNILRYRY